MTTIKQNIKQLKLHSFILWPLIQNGFYFSLRIQYCVEGGWWSIFLINICSEKLSVVSQTTVLKGHWMRNKNQSMPKHHKNHKNRWNSPPVMSYFQCVLYKRTSFSIFHIFTWLSLFHCGLMKIPVLFIHFFLIVEFVVVSHFFFFNNLNIENSSYTWKFYIGLHFTHLGKKS